MGGYENIESGVYFGWAGLSPSKATETSAHQPGRETKYTHIPATLYEELNAITRDTHGAVYPMVMSIGWNPYYKNTVRSVEVHVMHHFEAQFYDSHMNLLILGFIRPEYDYVSKEKLIEDIKTDINVAGQSLIRPHYRELSEDAYLTEFEGRGDVAS